MPALRRQEMSSKLAKFLEENKIDGRRVLIASRRQERRSKEDRAFLAAIAHQRSLAGKKESFTPEKRKLASGHPVTEVCLTAALEGKSISGPAKTRMLRAVNHILEQRKKPTVDLRALF